MADAFLLQDGWEWHYDDATVASKRILTSIVNVGGSTEINIPTQLVAGINLTTIGASCFAGPIGMPVITKVLSMPATLTTVGNYAFLQNTAITSVIFGTGVTSVGTSCFYGCTALTSADIPNGVTVLNYGVFLGCSALVNVTFGGNVTTIAQWVFLDCTALDSITFLSLTKPTSIHASWLDGTPAAKRGHAFSNSNFPAPGSALTGLTMGVVIAGDYIYTIDGGVATITGYIGAGGAASVPSPLNGYTVVAIGTSAFVSVKGKTITSMVLPDTVLSIGPYAFMDGILTSIDMGVGVTSIADYAFFQSDLINITIPNSVTSIGISSFQSCGDGVVSIGSGVSSMGAQAFRYSRATSYVVNGANATYASVAGVLYNKAITTLIQYPVGSAATSFTIPNSVTSIGEYAFFYAVLTSLTVGTGVTTLGTYCLALTSLLSITFLGLVKPTGIGAYWIRYSDAALRGHANPASNFPCPGSTFPSWGTPGVDGIMMGAQSPLPAYPTATIDSVSLLRASQADSLDFAGHGTATSCEPTYAWYANMVLVSTDSSFTITPILAYLGVVQFRFRTSLNGLFSDYAAVDVLVGRYPPTAVVDVFPATGSYLYGTWQYFEGHGESELNIVGFQWSSSKDGLLSTENRFQTPALSVGVHAITFRVQDERGYWSGWLSVCTLTITSPVIPPTPTKPTATIVTLVTDVYLIGDVVPYVGSGTPNLPAVSISNYEWFDTLTGLVFSTTASGNWTAAVPGTHIMRFKVKDNLGMWSDQVQRTLYVDGKPTPLITTFPISPQVAGIMLSFAGTGTAFLAAFGSTITAYEWSSNLDGVLSLLASFSTATLSQGTHHISFKVKDNYGVWSDPITMSLVIQSPSPPPPIPPNPALESVPSSVRVETWRDQRTRRGVR